MAKHIRLAEPQQKRIQLVDTSLLGEDECVSQPIAAESCSEIGCDETPQPGYRPTPMFVGALIAIAVVTVAALLALWFASSASAAAGEITTRWV